MAFIDFTNGEVLTADQMDTVMRQSVMKFADAAARDTALSAVLAEGMMCYLDDTDEVLKYDGSNWIDISGDITGVTAGVAMTGGGASGNVTLNVDTAAVGSAIGIDTKQDDVITTQGDLVIGDASGDPVRLPVGTADQVLTSDGTTVSFQDAGGGGGIELISSTSLSGASVSLTSISQDFKHLLVFVKRPRVSADNIAIDMRLNGVAGGYGNPGMEKVRAPETFTGSEIEVIDNVADDSTDGGNEEAFLKIKIPFYTSNVSKLIDTFSICAFHNSGFKIQQGAYVSENLNAVDEIEFFPESGTFTNGTIELYGVN